MSRSALPAATSSRRSSMSQSDVAYLGVKSSGTMFIETKLRAPAAYSAFTQLSPQRATSTMVTPLTCLAASSPCSSTSFVPIQSV